MEALEAILSRRSIRQFKAGKIDDEDINTMLEAAMSAPSAGDAQPWHFVVIKNKEYLNRIPSIHPYASMATEAEFGILVCADPEEEKHPGNWPQDCAAATENLLLACHAIGWGAVWTGIHPDEEREKGFRDLFSIPESIIPFCFIPIGRPAVAAGRVDRINKERIHFNKW